MALGTAKKDKDTAGYFTLFSENLRKEISMEERWYCVVAIHHGPFWGLRGITLAVEEVIFVGPP